MKRKISVGFVCLTSLFAITGCGTTSNTTSSNQTASNSTSQVANNATTNTASNSTGSQASTSSSSASLLSQIKKRGSIKIGTEGTYAPFSFHDNQNKLTGFDVEMARAVAKQLGVKADFVETPWDGMFAGLNDKRFDMIANEVGITPSRKKKYDFSTPYITSASVLIVRKSNQTIHSFADLKGKKSAQSLTSNFAKIAQTNGAKIVSVQGFNDALQLLESGRADATVNDKLSFLTFLKAHPNAPLKIVATTKGASHSAFAFRQGNPQLVKAVDNALATLEKNGTYNTISNKWFNQNVLH